MLFNAVKSVQTSTLGRLNKCSTHAWHGTVKLAYLDDIQLCVYIWRTRDTLLKTTMYRFLTEKTDGFRGEWGIGLRYQLSATYNVILTSPHRHFLFLKFFQNLCHVILMMNHMVAAEGNKSLMSHTWRHFYHNSWYECVEGLMSHTSKQLIYELHFTCDPNVHSERKSTTQVNTSKV